MGFFKAFINNTLGGSGAYGNFYLLDINKDTKTEINSSSKNQQLIFVDGNVNLSGNNDRRVYDYSTDDTITLKGGTNYIESGLGSDAITTGDGNDIIYTNANIDDKFDNETNSTINTVNSGKGDDTIYGSKGKDIIASTEGINHIFSGGGSDTINTTDGNNTIYTGISKDSAQDMDNEGDINSVNLTSGNNTIYGSKAQDIVISKESKSSIYTKEGDDKVTIDGGELNYVFTGSGNDTIEINGGKGHIVYTNTDQEQNSLGITLKNKVGLIISDVTVNEKDKKAIITLNLIGEIVGDGELSVKMKSSDDDFIIFKKGNTTKTYSYDIKDYDDFIVNTQKTRDALNLHPYRLFTNNAAVYDPYSSKYGNLKIVDDDTPVQVSISGNSASEGAEHMRFDVSLSRALKEGEWLDVNAPGGMLKFKSGEKSKKAHIKWSDDKIEEEDSNFIVYAKPWSGNVTAYGDDNGAECTIYDDKKPKEKDPKTYDPIVIDLNKDGIKLLSLDGAINFDHDGNGFKEATGWISQDDAFLAIDKNGSGTIDNGNELFGANNASNGFEELKKYDSNKDGVIDSKDEVFDNLLLWRDLNSNAISDDGEIIKLKDFGITSIELNYYNVNITEIGNIIKQISKVTFKDGTSADAKDINFAVDKSDTVKPKFDLSDELLALPDVEAKGNVLNLRASMKFNDGLKNAVKEYMSLDLVARKSKVKEIIYKWMGVENIAINSRGSMKDARELGVYEAITGELFAHVSQGSNPNGTIASLLHDIYQEFENYVYANLELQIRHKDIIDTKYMRYDLDKRTLGYNFDKFDEICKGKDYGKISDIVKLTRQTAIYKPNLRKEFDDNLSKLCADDPVILAIYSGNFLVGTQQ